ncbi:phosphoenolpyruvate--protein phosphotransferase [Mesorhizobium sp. M2D.F.Ca.ET.185.01.1.1]|uniref:phosphoenolpyruvate--protein phosphotransferase n=3 Tax=Mesorhizobium TaxID=68287 RepID=UPI000FCBE7B9|nr:MULTISPECIES: phosphoenolpyruvate--protein phosphotransferase [unclassified Mesorhizobium]TGP52388.1 phosphoenolpyruvate--protein phosphotransferase [bacterium M00.F.Ca.ET.230.01.1.1]TGP73684.1 phosphoenolpyruvate--protein phosphotransferase [bacterium M00.F.Ca.ET.227.01.1.1]TGP86370.1 phosphoenolpyruvate--protein phosphotransferase [bacterium M00.F.Ca.ET.221.01.1.1]TGP86603.1 phosphoenolpyruvate--protein phosphotransferase [bacterium M00.F.Ca.ET.222.01.1.1]TGT96002.1 phosphoenolpyruvate--p
MERSTIVRVHEGLHARPATRFVKLAKGFESDVELVKDGKAVSAKSSVKLMLLAVKENQEVTVRANGADAIEAVEALIGYLENPRAGLDDESEAGEGGSEAAAAPEVSPPVAAPADGTRKLQGVAASEGVAIGPAFAHFPAAIEGPGRRLQADQIDGEVERFRAAVAQVQARMDRTLAEDNLSAGDRGIVAALRDIAADDSLTGEVERLISEGDDAVSAVIGAASTIAADFSAVDDHYLNARADDVHAVGRQICLVLLGQDELSLETIPQGAILIADDIGAWDLARAPLKRIGGVVCGHGGATSHIAIIARSHGIPAVLGLGGKVNDLRSAKEVAIDGNAGHVIADPDGTARADFTRRVEAAAQERAGLKVFKGVTPTRADGTVIEVAANIGSLEEIEAAQEAGAMGVGLFRTELLFMRHMHLPSEDMQAETYSALAKAFAPHPVIVRTLDIGGDKPIAGIEFPDEENPFLGWRGIRMCLDRPDIFKRQLRALLRAAVHGNIKVMLPMVSEIAEVTRTRALVDECEAELRAEGVEHASFDLGVMIETPAAVLISPALAKEVAFFSIGTNDLTQYIMAADRLNPTVAKLNDVTNPAVMAAIELTAKAGVAAGIMVGMCGEAAGRPDLIPAFIKMGLTELSMSPASIQRAKKTIAAMAAER